MGCNLRESVGLRLTATKAFDRQRDPAPSMFAATVGQRRSCIRCASWTAKPTCLVDLDGALLGDDLAIQLGHVEMVGCRGPHRPHLKVLAAKQNAHLHREAAGCNAGCQLSCQSRQESEAGERPSGMCKTQEAPPGIAGTAGDPACPAQHLVNGHRLVQLADDAQLEVVVRELVLAQLLSAKSKSDEARSAGLACMPAWRSDAPCCLHCAQLVPGAWHGRARHASGPGKPDATAAQHGASMKFWRHALQVAGCSHCLGTHSPRLAM